MSAIVATNRLTIFLSVRETISTLSFAIGQVICAKTLEFLIAVSGSIVCVVAPTTFFLLVFAESGAQFQIVSFDEFQGLAFCPALCRIVANRNLRRLPAATLTYSCGSLHNLPPNALCVAESTSSVVTRR